MQKKFNDLVEHLNLTEMAYGLGNFDPVTLEEFINIIMEYDDSKVGAKPISFTSVTNPVYRKTGFPYAKLYKVGQTAGMIGTDYESNVNAQREREGLDKDFVKQEVSRVKEWLSNSIGITNKDLKVIKYRPLASRPSYWVVETKEGQLKEVPKEEVAPFLSERPAVSSQGVEDVIHYRLYGLDKLIAVSFQGKEYLITDADPTRVKVFELVQNKLKS
jgi:hypothetical protein